MLKTGEKILIGSDAVAKYFAELASPADVPVQNRKVRITCEYPDRKTDSIGVPVSALEALSDMMHRNVVRRPQEEE
jgi:hypothetical protein